MAVAALIINYNMPERADALAEHIKVNCPADVYLIDNGSDIVAPAKNTNIWLPRNLQTTRGWLVGYEQIKDKGYDAYWFIITSAEFLPGDCLTPMIEYLAKNPYCVGIHPALSQDSTTSWEHLKTQGDGFRQVWMIDNIAALWRADFFDAHPFDPDLLFGWGIDLELSYLAHAEAKELVVSEPAGVRKITDIAYSMGRMGMDAERRKELARDNMDLVFTKKYGPNWKEMLYVE